MATHDDDITEADVRMRSFGDDTPPLMTRVPEAPPSHWGNLTSESRTLSPQYLRFLHSKKERNDGRK